MVKSPPKCDFCNHEGLGYVYDVPTSQYGVKVAVCNFCGLIQSVKTREKPEGRVVSPSSGADWGNIRHGKGLRLKAALPVLEREIPEGAKISVLDVGSNRGSFVRWMRNRAPDSEVFAVEPDGNVAGDYKALPSTMEVERLENVELPDSHFDFVYCSHTLEHADSASGMLKQIHASMKTGGRLFLEIPSANMMKSEEVVEEFFMDKHTFHFNRDLLVEYLECLGFEVAHSNDPSDMYYITLVLEKVSGGRADCFPSPREGAASANREIISDYASRLSSNLSLLRKVSARLHQFMARQKVAFWGASRIFDSLVKHGGLDTSRVSCLVDEHLCGKVEQTHGVPIRHPSCLPLVQPQVVVILARSSADEIAQKVRAMGIKSVIRFAELIENEK